MNLVRKDSSTGNLSGELPSSGVVGRTDGSTVPLDYVGEVINGSTIVDNTNVPAGSWSTASTITLSAGVWMLMYNLTVNQVTGATTGNNSFVMTRIADATGTSLVGNSVRLLQASLSISSTAQFIQGVLVATEILSPSSSTSYTLQAQLTNNVGTGASHWYNSVGNGQSIFKAVRIA